MYVEKKVNYIFDAFWKRIWQPICGWCALQPAEKSGLCHLCQISLPWIDSACLHCGYPMPQPVISCQRCRNESFAFDRVFAAFRYEWPIDYMIKRLKKQGELFYGRWLSYLLANYIGNQARPIPDILLAMPLHRDRLLERGFNQCVEIAKPLVKQLYLSVDLEWQLCHKIKATTRQSVLKATERRHNVNRAFTVTRQISGKRVVVIEDVITTGQTAHELATALKEQGACEVEFWCCASAVKD